MFDIHTHLIPNVDDGSPSMETSLEMVRNEVEQGVSDIICTPHHYFRRYVVPKEGLEQGFDSLVEAVKKENLPVHLYLGQEIYYTRHEDILGMLDRGELMTMAETHKVLLEFNFVERPDDFEDIFYNFSCHGYRVIVAHVERYAWMDVDTIEWLRKEGVLIQINSGSLLGAEGWKRKHFCRKLLKKGFVDYIASDTHSFRPSTMKKADEIVKNADLFTFSVEE